MPILTILVMCLRSILGFLPLNFALILRFLEGIWAEWGFGLGEWLFSCVL